MGWAFIFRDKLITQDGTFRITPTQGSFGERLEQVDESLCEQMYMCVCVCVRSFSVLYYAGRMWALTSEHKLIKLILPIGCHVLPTILMVEISPYTEAISTST